MLALFGKLFLHDKAVYISVTAFTLASALFDLIAALPYGLPEVPVLSTLNRLGTHLPLNSLGLGWVCPAAAGLVVGVVIHLFRRKGLKQAALAE